MLPADTLPPREHRFPRFLIRGVRSMVLGLFIAVILTAVYRHNFWPTLVYSLCIALGCWFFIDSGRMVMARWVHRNNRNHGAYGQWPGWMWMVLIIPLGTVIGYTFGNTLGNWITGYASQGIVGVKDIRQGLQLLGFALIPGIAATYFFYSRERLAMSEAQVQTAQRQAAENQLKLLESQLEPHMLFNTLANLRVLIGMDPPRAQAMLDHLIGFLRATLEASRSGSHSLSSEFARIADYMELMKIRMGDRLLPQFDLPPELADQPVPPLLLQPLVENAIKHGLEPHVSGGRLIVSAVREEDMLVLRVRDTGAGLRATGIDGTRFGLQQVRDRLATLHAGRASLELTEAADEDGGAVAIVRLPIR